MKIFTLEVDIGPTQTFSELCNGLRLFLSILLSSFSSLLATKLPSWSRAPFAFCSSPLSFTGFCSHKSLFCLILSWPPLLEGFLENTLASMWNQATLPYFLPGQVWCYQRRRFRTAQVKPQPHGSFIPVPMFGIDCASEAGYEAEEIDHPLQDT